MKAGLFDNRFREDTTLYRDSETGLPLALGMWHLMKPRQDGMWRLVDPQGSETPLETRDTFAAYRTMLNAYEAWYHALPVKKVYFIGAAAEMLGKVKIGTSQDVPGRLRQLQTGSPEKLQILATVEGDASLEDHYHRRFRLQRRHGEWFVINRAILEEIEKLAAPAVHGAAL